jgi:hypothetical protein
MPHQSAGKYRGPCVKVTRLTPKTPRSPPWSAAQLAALNYRRPFKIGNIVKTSVNALMLLNPSYGLRIGSAAPARLPRSATRWKMAISVNELAMPEVPS